MSDCMTFPDTVEEFMEQNKVVDTEQIYSNGTEFVPIFRMQQWFDHLPSAQPERKTGKWIHPREYGLNLPEHQCSVCGEWEYSDTESNYCSFCGSYNGGEQDASN